MNEKDKALLCEHVVHIQLRIKELEEDVGEVIDQINNAKAIRKILTNLIENSDDTP